MYPLLAHLISSNKTVKMEVKGRLGPVTRVSPFYLSYMHFAMTLIARDHAVYMEDEKAIKQYRLVIPRTQQECINVQSKRSGRELDNVIRTKRNMRRIVSSCASGNRFPQRTTCDGLVRVGDRWR